MEQFALRFEAPRKLYSVSELNARIRELFDGEFGLVTVAGEISGTKLASSGHYYFTLKDASSQLKCACFRMTVRYLKFKPQDGISVLARGRLDVYDSRGEYQLLVESLEPQGYGALQVAFELLKKKLASEGLFEQSRKRALPKMPARIGLVTSPSGAVIQDMLHILGRRFPGLHIRLFPASVQGEEAVEQVCRGIQFFSESSWADIVIVARGGGSLEDLWTFNEEAVARAIAASTVPVVSAIGHETDFTIADFVADLRAPTPSAAAEVVICTREQLLDNIARSRSQLEQRMRYRLSVAARALHEKGTDRATAVLHRSIGRSIQRTDELERCVSEHARRRVRQSWGSWQDLDHRLRRMDLRLRFAEAHRVLQALQTEACQLISERLARSTGRRDRLSAQLSQLSPLRVLDRGYAIVQDESGRVIKAATDAPVGTDVRIRLAHGGLVAQVKGALPSR